jgi:hypothetical protein
MIEGSNKKEMQKQISSKYSTISIILRKIKESILNNRENLNVGIEEVLKHLYDVPDRLGVYNTNTILVNFRNYKLLKIDKIRIDKIIEDIINFICNDEIKLFNNYYISKENKESNNELILMAEKIENNIEIFISYFRNNDRLLYEENQILINKDENNQIEKIKYIIEKTINTDLDKIKESITRYNDSYLFLKDKDGVLYFYQFKDNETKLYAECVLEDTHLGTFMQLGTNEVKVYRFIDKRLAILDSDVPMFIDSEKYEIYEPTEEETELYDSLLKECMERIERNRKRLDSEN